MKRIDRVAVRIVDMHDDDFVRKDMSYLWSGHGGEGHSAVLWAWIRGVLRVSPELDSGEAAYSNHDELLEGSYGGFVGRYEPETGILTLRFPEDDVRREIPKSLWRDLEREFPDMEEVQTF